MSLIRLSDIDPRIPRPGWPGRRRAIARLGIETVFGAVCLIGALVAMYFGVLIVAAWMGPVR